MTKTIETTELESVIQQIYIMGTNPNITLPYSEELELARKMLENVVENQEKSEYFRWVCYYDIVISEDAQARAISKNPDHIENLARNIERKGKINEPLFLFENESNSNYLYSLENGIHRFHSLPNAFRNNLQKLRDYKIPAVVIGRNESHLIKPALRALQMMLNESPPRLSNSRQEIFRFLQDEISKYNIDLSNEEAERNLRAYTKGFFHESCEATIDKAINTEKGKRLDEISQITHQNPGEWKEKAIKQLGLSLTGETVGKGKGKKPVYKGRLPNNVLFKGIVEFVSKTGSSYDQLSKRNLKCRTIAENGRFIGTRDDLKSLWIFGAQNTFGKVETVINYRKAFFRDMRYDFDMLEGHKIAMPWDYLVIVPQISTDCEYNTGTKKKSKMIKLKGEKLKDPASWKIITKKEVVKFFVSNSKEEPYQYYHEKWILTRR